MQIDCGICVVRSWRANDLDSLVRHADNRRVWLQLRDRFPHPYTRRDGEHWLEHAVAARPETNFAIDVGGEAVGGIGFVLGADVARLSAEVGYWLGESLWGRGIATAALREAPEYAFAAFLIRRIFALPFADNLASRRVLEKAGFSLEGLMRQSAVKNGRLLDQALYALIKNDIKA